MKVFLQVVLLLVVCTLKYQGLIQFSFNHAIFNSKFHVCNGNPPNHSLENWNCLQAVKKCELNFELKFSTSKIKEIYLKLIFLLSKYIELFSMRVTYNTDQLKQNTKTGFIVEVIHHSHSKQTINFGQNWKTLVIKDMPTFC